MGQVAYAVYRTEIKEEFQMETAEFDLFARIALEEIEQECFGTTKQLLEIHSVEYENGLHLYKAFGN